MAMLLSNSLSTRAVARPARAVQAQASLRQEAVKAAKVAGVSAASLALALSAQAVTVKLGADGGGLVFDPASVTIKAGDSVEWVNNAGFPHNVVFDDEEIPDGANAEALSHEDYLNAPGQKVSSKFSTPGKYTYHCEPHQSAGMNGTVTVQ